MLPPLRTLASTVFVASITGAAQGHEFWIEPQAFTVAPGDTIVADLKVGEEFEGIRHSYLPATFRLFEMAQGDVRTAVESRLGDRPALNQAAAEGLTVLLHVTTDSRLTYREFAKFESFVSHKDAAWAVAAHATRGLPEAGFVEAYSRYAKALVAVGHGAGADRAYGLETELVALANPYTDAIADGIPVQLLYQGEPRRAAQIEVFERAPDGSISVLTARTDEEGVATIPVAPGHDYMLDAVVLREPSEALAAEKGAVWESLWANLTFGVPEN